MGSRKAARIVAAAAAVGLAIGVAIVQAGPSYAVHDNGMFELDGNIVHNAAATPPYDWASLFDANGNRLVTPDPVNGPLLASGFVTDSATPDHTYFVPSNTDQDALSEWGCVEQSNPTPKDELLHAYAALVQVPAGAPDNAGHAVLYVGSERESNNGDSFAGFWLLKDSSAGCTHTGSGSSEFTGVHTDGDLLILSNYTNGGGASDIQVYRWTGNDATGGPVLQGSFSGSVCGSVAPDNACAIANTSTITSPWAPTSHATNTFLEAGIDLTALLGPTGGCFTTALAETRSSQQITATLKDFARMQFNTCVTPPITTTATPGGSLVAPGAAQHDVATLTAVPNRGTPTGTVSFFLCGPAEVTAGGCPTGGTQIGGPVTVTAGGTATSATASGAADTALGKYCWRAEYTPDAASAGVYLPGSHTDATAECFTVVHASPTITTQIAVGGPEPPGLGLTTLGDTATLHGSLGNTDGETVTFRLYGPYAAGVTPTCQAGDLVFTATGPLSGGTAQTSQTYSPTQAGTYVWVASYPGDPLNDAVTGLCSDANESATIVGAVVDVSKSPNPPGPVDAGDPIGFDITVTNTGDVSALGVHVTDTLPAGTDLNWTLDPSFTGCTITGAVGAQVLNCDLGTVAGAASVGPIHVSSPTTSADCGTVNNQATVTTTNGTGGDSDLASVVINCAALHLTKTADAATVDAGSPIGFTITASNSGAGTAHGVTISDPLPTGTGISWSIESGPAGCAITSNTLSCTIGDLAQNASVSVHVVSPTQFASCATYHNTATLASSNAPPPPPAEASTTVQCPDVTLTKTADAATVNAGGTIGFTVTVANAGPATATGVTISDPLPGGPGVTWTIGSQSPTGSCSITGTAPTQTLTCGPADLASGAGVTVHVTSPTTFGSCATYDNTASVTVTNQPDVPDASATTSVVCADLHLTKTADAETVSAGSQIGFTITATNSDAEGTGTAHNVVIHDPLPTGSGVGWTIESQSPEDACSIADAALTCSVDSLAPGDSVTVHVVSPTEYASCAEYPNKATLTASNAPTLEASASTTVQCPAVTLTKTADAESVNAGSPIGFTITAKNAGPGTASGVVIDDPLPSGDGIDWKLDSSAPANCQISASPQTLSCTALDLAAGESESVHVTSSTTAKSCAAYDNTASVTVTNQPDVPDASARSKVVCAPPPPTPTQTPPPTPAPTQTPPPTPTPVAVNPPPSQPIAFTGVRALPSQLIWAVGLVAVGGALLALAARRRRRG